MDISRRDLFKVVSTSGLVAVGLAGAEALFSGVSAQNKPASTQTWSLDYMAGCQRKNRGCA